MRYKCKKTDCGSKDCSHNFYHNKCDKEDNRPNRLEEYICPECEGIKKIRKEKLKKLGYGL